MLRRCLRPAVFATVLSALVLTAGFRTPTSAENELPRIKFLATGGTIATRGGSRLTAEEVLRLVPGLQRYARPEPEQFANVASTALTLEQWLQLSRRVNQVFEEDPGLSGAVITS